MEYKELPGIILTLTIIGLVLGMGLLVIGEFGRNTRNAVEVTGEEFLASNTTYTDLAQDYISTSTATFSVNGTTLPASNFQFDLTGTFKGDKVLALNDSYNGWTINASYTYGASTDTSTAMGSTVTGLDDFVTWLPVFIVVIAAAIILLLVIRSFRR